MNHARNLQILNIFEEAVGKAQARRKGVTVRLSRADALVGLVRAQVTVASTDGGDFKLHFLVGANNEIAAMGPRGSIRCSLTPDSIEGAMTDEIHRELGLSPT
jgi:hypothetical protein